MLPAGRAQWTKYRERIGPPPAWCSLTRPGPKPNMTPLRGWAPRGQRIKAKVPHGRWQNHDLPGRSAPRLHHSSLAHRWADQWRDLPALRREGLGSDLAARRHRDHGQSWLGTRAKLCAVPSERAGARLFYLPKYSPDLNPIEQFFSKFKHWLRKSGTGARLKLSTTRFGPILDTVTSAECAKLLRQCWI